VEVILTALSGSFVAMVFHVVELFDFRRYRRRADKRRS
jgi:hypothetical protein